MKVSDIQNHAGWDVVTSCRENKPENWRPGDPIQYAASAKATLCRLYEYRQGWSTQAAQIIPEREFMDFNTAHDTLRAEMNTMIDELKL